MRLLIPCLIVVLTFSSCVNREKKLKQQVEKIVKDQIIMQGKIDSTVHILDEFILYRVDTLTDKIDSARMVDYLIFKLSLIKTNMTSGLEMAKLYQEGAKLRMNQAKLYQAMFGNDDLLTKMEFEDALKELDKSKEESKKVDFEKAKADSINNRIDNILTLFKSKEIDSTTFKGYIAVYGYKGADIKGKEIVVDTNTLTLSENLRIVPHLRGKL